MVYYVLNKIGKRCYQIVNFGDNEYGFVIDAEKEKQKVLRDNRNFLKGLKKI